MEILTLSHENSLGCLDILDDMCNRCRDAGSRGIFGYGWRNSEYQFYFLNKYIIPVGSTVQRCGDVLIIDTPDSSISIYLNKVDLSIDYYEQAQKRGDL